MMRRLLARALERHHARVRQASDHPLVHARRLLGDAARRRPCAPGLLCDVGSGSEPSRLAEAWPGRRIAVDLRATGAVDVAADARALPLPDKSVDAVLLMEVLEHVATPDTVLRECARVLVAGGTLCLTAPQYSITHGHPSDFYRYTADGLRHLCQTAGLTPLQVRATGGPWLVVFHAIERNLPTRWRLPFVAATYRLFDALDGRFTDHGNGRGVVDAVGWAVLAVKG